MNVNASFDGPAAELDKAILREAASGNF